MSPEIGQALIRLELLGWRRCGSGLREGRVYIGTDRSASTSLCGIHQLRVRMYICPNPRVPYVTCVVHLDSFFYAKLGTQATAITLIRRSSLLGLIIMREQTIFHVKSFYFLEYAREESKTSSGSVTIRSRSVLHWG